MAGNADLAVDSFIIVLSNRKRGKVFCTWISEFSSWILQIVFTVGIPCFQGDRRQSRYLINLGFRPPICKNSPEEFWKLKSKKSVRLLCLVLGFLFSKTSSLVGITSVTGNTSNSFYSTHIVTLNFNTRGINCVQEFISVESLTNHFFFRMFASRAAMPLPTTW